MALLDKVRQTLSNIGQKIDRNPTKTGVQLLPPVSFNKPNFQPITKAIQSYQARPSNQIAKTIGSAFRPALEATGTFGNLAYQSIFNQPKLNRQMAVDTQKALDASNRALQAAKAAREAGRPDLAAQYTRSMIPQLQAQSNKFTQSAKEAEAKRNALISSGVRTALYTSAAARLPASIGAGAVGAGLNAAFGGQTSPDQIARSFGESFKYGGFPNLAFKGGLLARSLAGGAQNLAEDVAYAKLVEGRNLTPREAIISAATPGAFEAIGQFSRQVRKSVPKEVVEKVDPSGLMYNKAGQLFDPINGRWAKNTKDARLAAKHTKDFIASGGVPVKAGTRLVKLSDGMWVDESLINKYKSEIDTLKLSVEPTGGEYPNIIKQASKYKSADEFIKAAKSGEFKVDAVGGGQIPVSETQALYKSIGNVNEASLEKKLREIYNQSKPLSVEPVGGKLNEKVTGSLYKGKTWGELVSGLDKDILPTYRSPIEVDPMSKQSIGLGDTVTRFGSDNIGELSSFLKRNPDSVVSVVIKDKGRTFRTELPKSVALDYANSKLSPSPLGGKVEPVAQDLLSEARKYKSAEEFINNLPEKTFIRGEGKNIGVSSSAEGLYTTSKPSTAKSFGEIKTAFKPKPEAKLVRDASGEAGKIRTQFENLPEIPENILKGNDSKKITEWVKQNGYDGVVQNLAGREDLIIINPDKFYQSQLTDIYNQAKGVAQGGDLISEARKYKSAEEFYKAQPKLFRYGGEIDKTKGYNKGISFTPKAQQAIDYQYSVGGAIRPGGKIESAIINPNAKVLKSQYIPAGLLNPKEQDYNSLIRYARSKGYDAVEIGNIAGENEIRVLNPKVLTTQKEAYKIYNQAQSSPLGGKVGEVKTELTPAKVTDIPQLNKQLESIQPEPKALDNLGISTKLQPELQTNQTLRKLKQESAPLDNIISEARKQIGSTPEPKDKSVKQVMDDLYTQWVDRYNPIVKASQQAKKTLKTQGAELRPEFDPEYLVRRLTGAGGIADYRFKTELNPIIKEMESLNIPKSDMDVYLANKRIAGFGKAGRDIYGADPKKAQEVVAAIENKYGNIQGLAQKFYDYQNKGFQEMVDAGFISPEAAKTIKSQNPDYAPLYRVMDEMDEYLGLPTRKTMQGTQPISKLKGSTRQIESPVESIIGNTFKQRAAIEKNRVAQSIVGLQNIADMGFTKASKASPETITVWNNGKKEYWNVGKDIAEVAKGQNEESMNLLLKVLQAPASLLRQGATGRNPEFIIPNIIRDQIDAAVTSKYGYVPFIDYGRGLMSMIRRDDIYQKWANSGAQIDLGEISGKKSIKALFDSKTEKKKLSGWLSEGLDVLGTISEQPTRIGLFRKAYEKTGNPLIAAMESRDATVDFARMGSKMKVANSIIPFLNVGVQGFDKLIRSLKNNPGKVMLNASIYGVLPAAMTTLYNLSKDPEAYDQIPQYEKDSNFIIVTGKNADGTVDYLSFPKGNVIPAIANPIESLLAYTKNEDPQAFQQMLTSTLTQTLPVIGDGSTMGEVATKTIGGLIPQGIKPLAENLLNKSFYKYDTKKEQSKEIVPYYMQNKPAYQQTYEFTPQMYQKIGAVFNASPLKVKNLMEGYLAGYVKIPAQIYESMYKSSRGEEISPNDKTLIRRFIKQTYPSSGKAPEVKPEVPGLMERVTGKVGAAEKAPEKITYTRKSDNSTQTIKLSDLQKPTGTTLKDYLSSGNRESTIREIYKAYAKGEIDQSTMNKAFSGAGVSVREAENLVIATLPTEQKATLVYDRLVSPQSQLKDLEELVSSKLLTTAVINELSDTGKINDQQESALKNYLKQKSGKVSKGKKPKKFKPTKFKAIKLKGAKKTYLKQKKLTLKDLLRK